MLLPVMLKNDLDTLSALGIGTQDMLWDIGITPSAAAELDCLVAFSGYRRAFERIACFNGVPGLGLEFGLRSNLGILSEAGTHCRSVRHFIEDLWARFGYNFGMMALPSFEEYSGGAVAIGFSTPVMSEQGYRLCIEDALSRIYGGALIEGSHRISFSKIYLSYSAPEYSSRYEEIFNCPVYFNQRRTRVIVDCELIDRPLPNRNDSQLWNDLRSLRQSERAIRKNSSVTDRVSEILLRHNSPQLPKLTETAKMIGMSGRSLRRALQNEQTCFRGLVEWARKERMITGAASGKMTPKEIGYSTGYRDLSAFRRAFKRWTNQTVGNYLAGYEKVASHAQDPNG